MQVSQAGFIGAEVPLSTFTLRLLKPDGTQLSQVAGGTNGVIESQLLPVSGTYTILVDPLLDATGAGIVQLYQFADDITGTIAVNGQPVTVTTTTPGQDARLTFTGTAGQKINLQFDLLSSLQPHHVKLLAPDGTVLTDDITIQSSDLREKITLPVTGTYTVWLDFFQATLGTIRCQLFTSPPDITGTLAATERMVVFQQSLPGVFQQPCPG